MLENQTVRVPWTAKRSNQSSLKEINPEYSLKRLMLKLKLQYFSHPMWKANSLEKTLMLGKTEDTRRGWQDKMVGWHHQLNGHKFEQAPGDGEGQGSLVCCSPWGRKESDTTEWLNNKHFWCSSNTLDITQLKNLQRVQSICLTGLWALWG